MSTSTKTLLLSVAVLVLTVAHHLYGAAIHATPWRHHVALVAVPVLLVLILAEGLHRWRPSTGLGRSSRWLFIVVVALIPVAAIGIVEGGYNHLAKNVLFFTGASRATFERLFPPPVYEAPRDAWFEGTGLLQLVLGLLAARSLRRLWREGCDEESPGTGSRAVSAAAWRADAARDGRP